MVRSALLTARLHHSAAVCLLLDCSEDKSSPRDPLAGASSLSLTAVLLRSDGLCLAALSGAPVSVAAGVLAVAGEEAEACLACVGEGGTGE